MPLSSPQRSRLADQVIAQLRAQITSGEWPVGSRIPTEPELVEQLGVARNTLREAVRALAHAGLLDIRQGSGTYVRATSELAETMRRRFAETDPAEILELRRMLEVSAARLAAERHTAKDAKLLRTALDRRERAWTAGAAERFVEADAVLHHAVVAAAHNTALERMYADLGEVLRDYLRLGLGPELTPDRYVDHSRLVEAVLSGDGERAARESGLALDACAPRG
jgi:DNA-binding FadR family transcriptional regulator